jgi:hypothetical protein
MKEGDIIYPIVRSNTATGQLALPLWGSNPALLIQKKLYKSIDPADCQSETEDWRWIVLHDGDIMWWSETLIGQFFEYR